MSKITQTADQLDILADSCIQLASALWSRGLKLRRRGDITNEQHLQIKAQYRALHRRSMELITTASSERLKAISPHLVDLKKATKSLNRARKRIENISKVLNASLAAVAAVSFLVAAVAAPSPVTISGAITSAITALNGIK